MAAAFDFAHIITVNWNGKSCLVNVWSKLGYIWVLTGRSAVWVRITECTMLVEQKSKQTAIDDKP